MSKLTLPITKSLVELASYRAEVQPDDILYRFLNEGEADGPVQLRSAGELERRARAIAAWLQERGYRGKCALLLYPPGLEFIDAFFGCLFAGVIAVPTYPPDIRQSQRALRRLEATVDNAGVEVVLTNTQISSFAPAIAAQAPAFAAVAWCVTDEISDELCHAWRRQKSGADSLAFLQYTSGSTSSPKGVMVTHGNLLHNLAIATQGSGHLPEELASHSGDLTVSWLPMYHDMGLIGPVLNALYVGRCSTLMSPLHFLQKPARWLQAITRFRPHATGGPNFAYGLCVRKLNGEQLSQFDLSSLGIAFVGAEPVRAETLRRFAETFAPCGFRPEAYWPCYGLAESTLLVTHGPKGRAPKVHVVSPTALERGQVEGGVSWDFDSLATGRGSAGTTGRGSAGATGRGSAGLWPARWPSWPPASSSERDARKPAGGQRSIKGADFANTDDSRGWPLVSCGRVAGDMVVKVVSSERRTECRPGEIGEIWVHGQSVASGYWNNDQETAETFGASLGRSDAVKFLRTGDLGFLLDGELFVTGRLKDLLIIDGKNHYPQDIEWVAEQCHPAVRPGCATAFAIDTADGERPVVVAEATTESESDLTAVSSAIRSAVSEAMGLALHSIVLVPPRTVPKTSSGKIQRRACRTAFVNDELPVVARSELGEPTRAIEEVKSEEQPASTGRDVLEWIIGAVAKRLRVERSKVRVDQPLFELGFGSMALVELTGELSELLGRDLPPTLLFDQPTINQVSRFLDEGETPAESKSLNGAVQPIAVLSMACRFPGDIDSPEELWRVLAEGGDAVAEFPAERWDVESLYDPDPDAAGKSYVREGGFIRDIDAFDAGFFGIAPREARSMDPQQRLLLETSWEALERAGIVPATLNDSETGAYVGLFDSGYSGALSLEQLDGYVGTGSFPSVASGRLAYTLGLQGPAATVDTACSSSLVALHMASQALRAGECDLALAGGITLMPTPRSFVEFCRLRGMSPSGRCKSFSDDADGTGWAEGCGLLVLKRLSDATRDGDRILGVIRGTAVNQDGRSQGLTAPSGPSQERVVRKALELSSLSPSDIDYVEAHGTGTVLGDAIEARALASVFGPRRSADRPLYIGSLKSNLAHTQAAAGVGGVIKVLLALQHEQLPATLHAASTSQQPSQQPSQQINWERSGLELVTTAQAWPKQERVRRAGVSAFGLSGTNAHVILEEAPQVPQPAATRASDEVRVDSALLFALSAKSEESLRGQAAQLRSHLEANPGVALADMAHTLAVHRTHFERRAAIVAATRDELLARLGSLVSAESSGSVLLSPTRGSTSGKLAFVFPGHGPQWFGMGKTLLEHSEVFRAAIGRCDAALYPHTGWSVQSVLLGEVDAPELERVDVVQPALFAMMVSLAAMWQSLGIEPDAVVGHSVGEVAAAHVCGALTLEDAARVVALRARELGRFTERGGMLAVELPAAEVEERLKAKWETRLSIAAINSARSTAVSGELKAIEELQAALSREEVFARRIRIRFAAHSPQVEEIRDEILAQLTEVAARPSATPFYSTVMGKPVEGDELNAAYWYRNVREPVQFAGAIDRLLADGFATFLEVSSHPMLGVPVETATEEAGVAASTLGTLRRDEDGGTCVLRALGQLYVEGRELDWSRFLPKRGRCVDLPTYPFERNRFWLSPKSAAQTRSSESPLLQVQVEASDEPGRHLFEVDIDLASDAHSYLEDHRLDGSVWLPAAAFLEMVFEAARRLYPGRTLSFEKILFAQPVELFDGEVMRLQLVLRSASNQADTFTISSRPAQDPQAPWVPNVSGRIRLLDNPPGPEVISVDELQKRCSQEVTSASVYSKLAAAGFDYGPAFRGIEAGWGGRIEAIAKLASSPRSAHVVHPAILDAAFQAVALPTEGPSGRTFVPSGIDCLRIVQPNSRPAWATCVTRAIESNAATLDVKVLDEQGNLLIDVQGFRLFEMAGRDLPLFEVRWSTCSYEKPVARASKWLILSDCSGLSAELASKIGQDHCVVVGHSERRATVSAGPLCIDPQDEGQWRRLLEESFGQRPPDRIVHLWSLDSPTVDSPTTFAEAQRLSCTSTLHLTRAIAGMGWTAHPRLFLVTRGSQAARGSEDVAHPQQALLWGLGETLAQEHPELTATLIDLDADAGSGPAVEALSIELMRADDETAVALRRSGRLVPRLVRSRELIGPISEAVDATSPAPSAGKIDGNTTYLVTGGLGALGWIVSERLIQMGARHLALLGRRAPRAEQVSRALELESQGVKVHVLSADVTERQSLERALDALRRSAPRIGGVVHAAGLLDDATLMNLSAETMAKVMAPKVLAPSLLAELLPDLDFFILFSSVAGLTGFAGQAAYSAGNAYLDAWAHHRSRVAAPALSLDWGAWEVGLASASDVRIGNLARAGVTLLSTERGGELFESLLWSKRRQLAPVAFDLPKLRRPSSLASSMPLLRDLVGQEPAMSQDASQTIEAVRSAESAAEQQSILEEYLVTVVSRVVGGSVEAASTTPLKEFGLDSLMFVNLRNIVSRELSIELSASTLLSLPTIERIAEHLLENLLRQDSGEVAGQNGAPLRASRVEGVQRLPATRDAMRLVRTEQQGIPSTAHHLGCAARLRSKTSPEQLEAILSGLACRHAALRTAVVADDEHGHSFEVHAALPGRLLGRSELRGDAELREEIARRLDELMAVPFTNGEVPLWRFELLEDPSGEQAPVLLYGAHHAVSDAQSLLLVLGELEAELAGRPLDRSLSNRDIESLLRAQQVADSPLEGKTAPNWRREFAGCKRLELTLASPRPSRPTFKAGAIYMPVSHGLLSSVADVAKQLAVTPAAFCLGALTALLARVTEQSRFAVAVPVDTRIHVGAPDAVGFFGVPVPIPATAHPDESLADVIRRTDEMLNRVLEQGAALTDALPALVVEGLSREGAPLVEAYFNYIRPQTANFKHIELLETGIGAHDLDLMVSLAPDLDQLRLDFNSDILDDATCEWIGIAYLELLESLTDDLARTGSSSTVSRLQLAEPLEKAARASRPARLGLAATFTIGPLSDLLETASRLAGESVVVEEAPYQQVLAGLLDPQGVFSRPDTTAGVVLLRAVDLVRHKTLDDNELTDLVDEYVAAISKHCGRAEMPLLVGFLPTHQPEPRFEAWESRLTSRLAELPGLVVLGPKDWERYYSVDDRLAPDTDALAHLPFHPDFLAIVALTLARTLYALRRPPLKVVAVDGDETLWGGIAGEIGPDAVDLTGPRATLARKLLELRSAGVLLVLVSNNDEATLQAVLERSDSILHADHFAIVSSGWDSKSSRLAQCARSLGLGLDSFVFLDDNPVEIAAVRSQLPEVTAVTVPGQAELESFLANLWALDVHATTYEDRKRAEFYRNEAARRALPRKEGDFASFVESLQIEMEIEPLSSTTVERSIQLSRRTNQFNLRPVMLDTAKLDGFKTRHGCEVWTATVRDRFGDYGQVGLLILQRDGTRLEILHWMLSCRALGRSVEERILHWIGDRASALGCSEILLVAEHTPRNIPARRLVAAVGRDDVDNQRLEAVATPSQLRDFRLMQQASHEA